jgi:cytochrome b subunit of formate dehydrogenase
MLKTCLYVGMSMYAFTRARMCVHVCIYVCLFVCMCAGLSLYLIVCVPNTTATNILFACMCFQLEKASC